MYKYLHIYIVDMIEKFDFISFLFPDFYMFLDALLLSWLYVTSYVLVW